LAKITQKIWDGLVAGQFSVSIGLGIAALVVVSQTIIAESLSMKTTMSPPRFALSMKLAPTVRVRQSGVETRKGGDLIAFW
jgi:hypothetical protein